MRDNVKKYFWYGFAVLVVVGVVAGFTDLFATATGG